MPKINLLPKNISELIAAGEVVERPASVIKELVENSIDANATNITVEINRGGITYIRVTDNGCGISFDDVPKAFLRHATSKISAKDDLDSIGTLGFRGEALAAISSVSRVEMLSATEDADFGTIYKIDGGNEVLYEESGCPKGTTIIIRDIFYNTPARMKFLKKDVSEANACAAVIDRIALSHPEISFKFIRDGKMTLSTQGNRDLKGTVYSVLGRDFANSLIEVNGRDDIVNVSGLCCKPVFCRPTRNNQFTFLNGRLVRSGTVIAAVEQAYKNSAMVGKFPSFVLFIKLPFNMVDVNVHPAKTEVRFSDEKMIFDSVYAAVKNALTMSDTRPEIKLKPTINPFEHITAEEYRQQRIETPTIAEKVYDKKPQGLHNQNVFRSSATPDFINRHSVVKNDGGKSDVVDFNKEKKIEEIIDITVDDTPSSNEAKVDITPNVAIEPKPNDTEEKPEIIIIGEAFSTYIVAQMGDSVFMIDKHAAHERIIFNELKENAQISVQQLLTPVNVVLSKEEYDSVINNTELLQKSGFIAEDFGSSSIIVRAIPSSLVGEDVTAIMSEIAENLIKYKTADVEKLDNLYHTVACKAAIKAGYKTTAAEMLSLAEKVLYSKDIMYCPHGRPVAFEIKRRELEKQFGRIQ